MARLASLQNTLPLDEPTAQMSIGWRHPQLAPTTHRWDLREHTLRADRQTVPLRGVAYRYYVEHRPLLGDDLPEALAELASRRMFDLAWR